jgi:flagellar hook assembly protein FlgD
MMGPKTATSTVDPSAATSLIGKSVRVKASDIIFDPAKKDPVEISVHTEAGTDSVLTILDSDEKIVNLLPLTAGGESKIKWNGLKATGGTAPAGNYHLKVTSTDGKTDTGYTFFEDKVTGIGYGKTGARVEVKGQSIALDQILHVGETAE